MSFVLIIFSDIERSSILKIAKFRKMKDIIKITDNKVNYYDVRRNNDTLKYRCAKSIYQVVKI